MRWERLYIAPNVNKTTKPWTPVLGQCSSDTTAVGLSYHNIQDHPLISAKTKKNSAMHVGFFLTHLGNTPAQCNDSGVPQ